MANKALDIMRFLPRVCLSNIRPNPHLNITADKRRWLRGRHGGRRAGYPHKGAAQRMSYPRVGYENGNTPFYLRTPMERAYYENHHMKRQYPPLSLKTLQLMVETGRIDPSEPIDVATLCQTHLYTVNPNDRHFGVQLNDEGIDNFTAKLCIEVQYAPEHVIAAIERNGGVLTTAYYDINSIRALLNPMKYFGTGRPIPKRQLPPQDGIGYYLEAKNRGYLADPDLIAVERLALSQKYGYVLADIQRDEKLSEIMKLKKDPRQIFYGLRPGWLINLKDKTIMEPLDPEIRKFYELDDEILKEDEVLENK